MAQGHHHPGRHLRRLRSVRPRATAAGVRRGQVPAVVHVQIHRQQPERVFPSRSGALLFGSFVVGRLRSGRPAPVWQQPGLDRLRPEPDTRRRDVRGHRTAAGERRQVPDLGEAQLAWSVIQVPGRAGQEADRALQRSAHRDRHDRHRLRRLRPGARLLPACDLDPLQPGNQEPIGAQGAGHHPGQPHRVGRRLERYRPGLPDDQARHDQQRPGHLQRFAHRRHRSRRCGVGNHACPAVRTPQHGQKAAQPLRTHWINSSWQNAKPISNKSRRNGPCGRSRSARRNPC